MGIELGRSPTAHELCERLEISECELLDGLLAGEAWDTTSLEVPRGDGECDLTLGDTLPYDEPGYDLADARASLERLVRTRCRRDREVVRLRFEEDLTQREIGERLADRVGLLFGYPVARNADVCNGDPLLGPGLAGEGDDLAGELVCSPGSRPGRDQRRQPPGVDRGGRLVIRRPGEPERRRRGDRQNPPLRQRQLPGLRRRDQPGQGDLAGHRFSPHPQFRRSAAMIRPIR